MASIQGEIFEEFCRQLEGTEEFTKARVKQIRQLFAGSKKPKPTELVKALSEKEVKESMA